jgi:hypothetical protein
MGGGHEHLDEDLSLFQCGNLFFAHVQIIGGPLAILDKDTLHFFRDGGGHCAVPKEWAEWCSGEMRCVSCGCVEWTSGRFREMREKRTAKGHVAREKSYIGESARTGYRL